MTVLGTLLLLFALAAALLVGLAQHWSHTPHGRLKPIFALVFRLGALLNPAAAERAIGAAHMDTPAQRAKVRSDFARNTALLSRREPFDGTIHDRLLPGAPGGELPVRLYTPTSVQGPDPLPLVVYFHGGGFMVGSPDYTDAVTRILAARAPAVVVSVDYRLAPEHRLPAAADDCAFAVSWCFENAASLGARKGPVVVAGDSAGGNLAAVVAQRDLAAGRGQVALQVLVYPCLDGSRTDRESQRAFASGYGLTLLDVHDYLRHYPPEGFDRAEPQLSPLRAPSLAGLPPAIVVTAGFDVLRDEGIEYAGALKAAGVPVEHLHEPELPHGFATMTRLCSEARATLESIAAEVRALPRDRHA